MKQVFSNFYLLILLSGISYPQSGWVRQYPPPEAQNTSFLSVSFVDANTGFIVGGSGTILHTANGGTDWVSQLSGTTNCLRGISASNTNIATAVGDSGIILHTTNGGTTWIHQTSGTTHPLRAVSFTDANTGSVVGDSGTILRTTNGGTTWMGQSSGILYNLNSISFVDANTGTAVGDSGTILRTTNGGTEWGNQLIDKAYPWKEYCFYGASFFDTNRGIAVGYYNPNCNPCFILPGGIIFHTTNGGITWSSQDNGVYVTWSNSPLNGVSLTYPNSGTVVGYDSVIMRTTSSGNPINGKLGWSYQSYTFGGSKFCGVCFTDTETGTIVGDGGTILHTTTGGVTTVNNNQTQGPHQFVLEQNYPNPFNPITIISYQLLAISNVSLKIYDVMGREVAILINERQNAGRQEIEFNASKLASGIYFYKLQTDNYCAAKKLLLLK